MVHFKLDLKKLLIFGHRMKGAKELVAEPGVKQRRSRRLQHSMPRDQKDLGAEILIHFVYRVRGQDCRRPNARKAVMKAARVPRVSFLL
jgi:hypothetical protein